MRIFKETYENLEKQLKLLDDEIKKTNRDLKAAVDEGDLSENAEFERLKDKLLDETDELTKLNSIMHNADVVKLNTNAMRVDIGVPLILKVKLENKVEVSINCIFCGAIDNQHEYHCLSTETETAKKLLNNPLGTEVILNMNGIYSITPLLDNRPHNEIKYYA